MSFFNYKENIPKALKSSLLFPLCFILFIGILNLYGKNNNIYYLFFLKHILNLFISFLIFFIVVSLDTKVFYNFAYHILCFTYIFLLIVLFFCKKTLGASRWIDFGIFKFQPSEFSKIAVVLFIARFFSDFKLKKDYNLVTLFKVMIAIFPIIFLSFLQPDLSTSVIISIISLISFFVVGFRKKYLISIALFLLTLIPIIWFKFLKEYQKLRIINFLKSNNDQYGSGYNILQSKISIGSGGFFGKGLFKNTQEKLRFLPENHTDFIFSSICEEFGFFGSTIIIAMYMWIIYYGMNVAQNSKIIFNKLLAIGCSSLIFLHFFINVAMVTGILPVAGIPLIFISYGGSNLIVGMICIALIINIDISNKN